MLKNSKKKNSQLHLQKKKKNPHMQPPEEQPIFFLLG